VIVFYLLVSVMPMVRHPLWSDFIGDLTLIKYLGAICFVFALVYLAVRPTPLRLLGNWQARWFVLLALLGMGSYLTLGLPMPFEISPFMNYASFLILLFVTLALVDSLHTFRWTLLSAVASIAYASAHTIREWQKYGGMASGHRPGWITGDPNYFTVSAVLVLPLVFYLIRPGQPRWERWFCLASLALTLFAVTLASSRGGLLAMAASLLLIVLRSRRRVRVLVIGAALLIPLLALAPSSPLQRVLAPTRSDFEATDNRTRIWEAGLVLFTHQPWIGIGLGNYKPYVGFFGQIDDPTIAHNTYIEVAVELGLPGILLFSAILLSSFRSLASTRRLSPEPSGLLHRASLGIEGGLVAYMVAIVFISAEYQKFFWLLVFLSISLEALARAERARAPEAAPAHPSELAAPAWAR
jgi:O-antigen ligase